MYIQMECKKYTLESAWWINMALGSWTESIVTNSRKMLSICMKCEHRKAKECNNDVIEKILIHLENNDESEDIWPTG